MMSQPGVHRELACNIVSEALPLTFWGHTGQARKSRVFYNELLTLSLQDKGMGSLTSGSLDQLKDFRAFVG